MDRSTELCLSVCVRSFILISCDFLCKDRRNFFEFFPAMTICALIFPDHLCTQRDDERIFSLITHVSFFEIRADIPRVRVRISHDTPFSPWDVESDEGSF